MVASVHVFESIKNDLPNFPDEVIREWLLGYGETIGWPPDHQRWKGILFSKPLNYWQKVRWEKQELDLSSIVYSLETTDGINGMEAAYIKKESNIYGEILGKSGEERHISALCYLLKNGRFPKPVLLLNEDEKYSIVDGNHRFLAWKTYGKLMFSIEDAEKNNRGVEEIKHLKQALLEKWLIDAIAPFSPIQTVWVAKSA